MEAIQHPDSRVLAFHTPPRRLEMPIAEHGSFWGRAGAELRSRTTVELRRIFDGAGLDYSAELNRTASFVHLDRH